MTPVPCLAKRGHELLVGIHGLDVDMRAVVRQQQVRHPKHQRLAQLVRLAEPMHGVASLHIDISSYTLGNAALRGRTFTRSRTSSTTPSPWCRGALQLVAAEGAR